MKNSTPIKKLPQGWTQLTLQDIAAWGSGGTPSRTNPKFFGGDIPWIKTGELGDKYVRDSEEKITEEAIRSSSAKLFPSGSVGIAMYGATIGKVSIWGIDASTNQACAVAYPHKNVIDKEFLYYFLLSQKRKFIDAGKGGAQPNISQGLIKEWPILLPPHDEQKGIVTKIEILFSELDKGIESLKAAREQLKAYRQSVLKHAFEGKLTARWRAANPDKLEAPDQLLTYVQQERESYHQQRLRNWKDAISKRGETGENDKKPSKPTQPKQLPSISPEELSLLPILPEGWSYVRLADITDIGSGMSVSKDRKPNNPIEVAYLRVANVQRGKLSLDEIKYMPIEEHDLFDLALKQWDVLFNEGGDRDKLGRGWIWEEQISPCITQNHVFRASPVIVNEYHAKFISHWGNTFGQTYFEQGGKQTTNLASINKRVLSMFPVPLPSFEEQEQIVRAIEDKMALVDSLEKEVENAIIKTESLRQSTLKKAFSGQLVDQSKSDEPASVLLKRIQKIFHPRIAAKPSSQNKLKLEPAIISDVRTMLRIQGISTTDLHAGILALAYFNHQQVPKYAKHFHHVKGEKIAHLVEAHLNIDLDRHPVKDAAGPNDFPHLKKVESRARKTNWFSMTKDVSSGIYHLKPGRRFGDLQQRTQEALGEHLKKVEGLLTLLSPLDTTQSEIVATLYAAWNNLLLTGQDIVDESIVTEARENWHPNKLNIERSRFFDALKWMREKSLTPKGQGRYVGQAAKKKVSTPKAKRQRISAQPVAQKRKNSQ